MRTEKERFLKDFIQSPAFQFLLKRSMQCRPWKRFCSPPSWEKLFKCSAYCL